MTIEIKSSKTSAKTWRKFIIYGRPGKGKTMITPTCPKPILLLTEPGGADSLTERNIKSVFGEPQTPAQIKARLLKEGCPEKEADALSKALVISYDIPRLEIFDLAALKEAIAWLKSPAAAEYQTVVMDSLSAASKMLLAHHETKTKHGMKAYGAQAKDIEATLRDFLSIPKHVVCLMQAAELTDTVGTGEDALQIKYLVPSVEGRTMKMAIPHMFGEVYQADTKTNDAGQLEYFLQTRPTDPRGYEKTRMSILQDQEVPHIGQIIHTMNTHG